MQNSWGPGPGRATVPDGIVVFRIAELRACNGLPEATAQCCCLWDRRVAVDQASGVGGRAGSLQRSSAFAGTHESPSHTPRWMRALMTRDSAIVPAAAAAAEVLEGLGAGRQASPR